MAEDPEPAENIGGGESHRPDRSSSDETGDGTTVAAFDPEEATTRAEAVVDRLGELYWQKTYGGRDAFECLVRTILSQNTSDVASQPAHDALVERFGAADDEDLLDSLADADRDELAETIRPAGLHNRKADVIVDAAAELREEFGGEAGFDEFVRTEDPETVRSRLLDIDGVGPKTADCVLLFAGGREGIFPVDTHVHRIYRRLGIAPPKADHAGVREILEGAVPADKCGFGHTASIQFGREYCSARKPACFDGPEACPLYARCDRIGVDPETDEAVDPADAHE